MMKKGLIIFGLVATLLFGSLSLGACSKPKKYAISELEFGALPVVYIETEKEKKPKNKVDYVPCSVNLLNVEEEYTLSSKPAGIRLRGNYTRKLKKKPYRIKFDEKTSPFGWKKNKSWVLLALYLDPSNIKDYAAFSFAKAIGSEAFVPHAQHVEVYLNGEYLGLYLFTDQVDENSGRTSVKQDFDANATEVPFLVEWDEYARKEGKEGREWFQIKNADSGVKSYFEVKYPEADERFSDAQFDYIQNYVTTVNTLCHADGTTQAQFEEYVDLKAFLDYYLVQELMSQSDINRKSINMSKAVGETLVMGPVWDFDWSAGGPVKDKKSGHLHYVGWMSDTNWFAYMMKKDWFQSATRARWQEMKPALDTVLDELVEYKATIAPAAEKNAVQWKRWTEGENSFDSYFDFVIENLRRRIGTIDGLLAI